jgi:AcrR family transcriptional regulator
MAELLRVQGYAATGLQQLARAAHAPTGSIHHHFPGGKREIAAAALRQAGAAYIQLLPMLLDEHADLATAIETAFTAAADDIANTGWANRVRRWRHQRQGGQESGEGLVECAWSFHVGIERRPHACSVANAGASGRSATAATAPSLR